MADTKYEYKIIKLMMKFCDIEDMTSKNMKENEKKLNDLGLLGWELISVIYDVEPYFEGFAYLKRAIK